MKPKAQLHVPVRLVYGRARIAKIEQCELRADVLVYWQFCEVYRIAPGRLLALLGKENPPA